MTNPKKTELLEHTLGVVRALSELLLFVEKEKFALDLFEASAQTTGALSCGLDELVAEWQAVANNIEVDRLALFESWKKSAMVYKDILVKRKIDQRLYDLELSPFDIVFEDTSHISVGLTSRGFKPILYVEIANICEEFDSFDEAAKYLWENHACEGYGV